VLLLQAAVSMKNARWLAFLCKLAKVVAVRRA
jgi:hypothetical protein